jgi:hypothetical protein
MSNLDYPTYLTPKEPAEIIPIVWTFNDPQVVVVDASATVSVVEGVDASPASVLGDLSFTGNTVTQHVQGGLHGVVYKIKLQATLAGGDRFVYTVILPVISA